MDRERKAILGVLSRSRVCELQGDILFWML